MPDIPCPGLYKIAIFGKEGYISWNVLPHLTAKGEQQDVGEGDCGTCELYNSQKEDDILGMWLSLSICGEPCRKGNQISNTWYFDFPFMYLKQSLHNSV